MGELERGVRDLNGLRCGREIPARDEVKMTLHGCNPNPFPGELRTRRMSFLKTDS